jgi:hypothetical protein
MHFETTEIKKCCMCKTENTIGYKEGVTTDIGIGESHRNEEFCEKCFKQNTFINSYGFTFLRYNNRLYCYKPYQYLDFGFRQVLSDKDVERAFNPEYYEFLKWMND